MFQSLGCMNMKGTPRMVKRASFVKNRLPRYLKGSRSQERVFETELEPPSDVIHESGRSNRDGTACVDDIDTQLGSP